MVAVVAAMMMRRGKDVSGGEQQRQTQHCCVNPARSFRGHSMASGIGYLQHRCR
jgi:hypothetical protein